MAPMPTSSILSSDWDGKGDVAVGSNGGLGTQSHSPGMLSSSIQDFCASILMMFSMMWVPDTLLVLMTAVVSVLFFDFGFNTYAAALDWTAVNIMLMFPLQHGIQSAYARREHAVRALAEFRALLVSIFVANGRWDWPGSEGFNGRSERSVKKGVPLCQTHAHRVRALMLQLCDVMQELLLLPRSGDARHEYWWRGREEKEQIQVAEKSGRKHALVLMQRLYGACEDLKAAGMPANEASRINAYVLQLQEQFESLWQFKTYRTPISLRAMMRVVVQILPIFYGPYWVNIAKGDSKTLTTTGILFAIFFSVSVSLITIAFIVMELQLENPYQDGNRDCVRVREEIELMRKALQEAFVDMHAAWDQHVPQGPRTPSGAH